MTGVQTCALPIYNAFGCSDLGKLREIVEQYESSGKAVLVVDGRVYEKMHIKRIKKILAENEVNQ